ncbi:MAG: helix-turn-helix domain-containing protein [Ruminiclostridium sp.]
MFGEYNDMLTIEDLCDMLHIGRSKAYNLLRSGRIAGFKDGRLWMIPKTSVIEFIINGTKNKDEA